jgi:hypothetical protein
VAIDLFQGDITTFSCDLEFVGKDGSTTEATCESALASIVASNGRHLAVAPFLTARSSPNHEAKAAMETVKDFLRHETDKRGLRRITFVLSSGEFYRSFQDKLFSTFPEEDQ